jgi:hypothetical protein
VTAVLRPEVPSWKRRDEEPEQLAREAIAEIQGALEGLRAMRELLASPKPDDDRFPEAGR